LMHGQDWKSVPVYMMDFEGSPATGVVEYGVVRLQDGRIQSVETALCRPSGSIPERDRELHGISESAACKGEPFASLYADFVDFRRHGVFAAHNRHAENTFLKDTWAVPPVVPDWRNGESAAQEWGPWIDTLAVYKALYPGLASYGLGELVAAFSLGDELDGLASAHCPVARRRPHCALYDALASSLLLLRLERVESLAGLVTAGWLLQLSEGRNSQQELF
jgi:DNA polymerase-3 subunit epsilon